MTMILAQMALIIIPVEATLNLDTTMSITMVSSTMPIIMVALTMSMIMVA